MSTIHPFDKQPGPPPYEHLVALLQWRAVNQPQQPAYIYLKDGLTPEQELDFQTLDRQVRQLAARLQQSAQPGDRALLLYTGGLEVVVAFWACLYAGIIAIPAPPPDSIRSKQSIPRLKGIARDAQVALILGEPDLLNYVDSHREELELSTRVVCLDTTTVSGEAPPVWQEYHPTADSVAYLQYTSGSTSSPKGVMITHANMRTQAALVLSASGADSDARWLTWLPYFHDYGLIHGIVVPMAAGNPSYLMSPVTFLRRPLRWLEAVSAFRITHSGAPNFAYELCAQSVQGRGEKLNIDLSAWRVASCGAEPVRASTMETFAGLCRPLGFSETALSPAYGLAEYTLLVSLKTPGTRPGVLHVKAADLEEGRVTESDSHETGIRVLVACGPPATDTVIVIVDPHTCQRVPEGRVGEIWIAGGSAAAGYWGRPDETEQTFGARLSDSGEGPFLRTGDLGFLYEGEVVVAGRLKDLIIVRGRNLYPQDIEATSERAHPLARVSGCAAFSMDAGRGEELVVVQEVGRQAGPQDYHSIAAAIRQAIAEDYDVHVAQAVLIRSGSLPKTSSGKVQRRACRTALLNGALAVVHVSKTGETAAAVSDVQTQHRPTSDLSASEVEAELKAIVAEQAGVEVDRIDSVSPLSRLGLDSLMVNIIRNRVEDRFGVSPSFAQLHSQWSLRELATFVTQRRDAGSASFAEPGETPTSSDDASISSAMRPLTSAQERLWFLEQLHPGTALNNLALGLNLHGDLSVDRLQAALDAVVCRHEMLRARIRIDGPRAYMEVQSDARCLISTVDLRTMAPDVRRGEARAIARDEASRPFVLEQGPLIRAKVAIYGPGEHRLFLTVHRLIADGWSLRLLLGDIGRFYSGRATDQAPDGDGMISVTDRSKLTAEERSRQLAYWSDRLSSPPVPAELPADAPRSSAGRFRGHVHTERLLHELTEEMGRFCRERNVTRFMLFHAAMAVWLARWTGQSDTVVGTAVANRRRADLEDRVGYLVNTVALRLDLSQCETVTDVWALSRRIVSEAYDHQDVPFDDVVAALDLQREARLTPLFRTMIVQEDDPLSEFQIPGLRVARLPLEVAAAEFDLVLMVLNGTQGCELALAYDTDLFEEDSIRRFLGQLQTLLQSMMRQPDARWWTVPIMSAAEHSLVIDRWNQTQVPIEPLRCVYEAIEEEASRGPDRIAVVCGPCALTYRDLLSRSRRVARSLRRLGVGLGSRVGLCMERSVDGIAAVLGILQAGAAYVPLDPTSPSSRLRFMADDAAVALVITDVSTETVTAGLGRPSIPFGACLLGEGGRWNTVDRPEASLDHAAYVIYTSGSTGIPKGVEVTHRNLASSMHARMQYYPEPVGRLLLTFSFAFDGSVTGIFWTLLRGGCLVIPEEAEQRDPRALVRLIARHAVTHVVWVPSLYDAVLGEAADHETGSLLVVVCAGERLPVELVRRHYRCVPNATLYNEYGPTEGTVWSTVYRVPSDQSGSTVPIGVPIANVRAYVVDGRGEPLPIGAVGELYVGGAGVARGYLNRPELTDERFLSDPFHPEGRVYRTGDLVRWRTDGILEFHGRVDHQVKLRGYRIELGEVESAICRYPSLSQAAVLLRDDRAGSPRLVAYLKGTYDAVVEERLRAHLFAELPAAMIPTAYVWLPTMPITVGGKVDRTALPAPTDPEGSGREESDQPQTPIEVGLAEIWKDVLQVKTVSCARNFFHLGGHSLLITQVAARIRERFHLEVPLRMLFERPTIRTLAEAIASYQSDQSEPCLQDAMPVVPRKEPLALSYSQRRMWFMYCLAPEGTAYNMPVAVRITGRLNRPALKQAAYELIRRHEAFRTSFSLGAEGPVQVVHDTAQLPWHDVDLRLLPRDRRESEAKRILAEDAARPFDLSDPPAIRVLLVQLDDDDHVLLLNMHHIIGDQWSFGIIGREFGTLYSAATQGDREASLPTARQYADYAVWQRRWLTEDRLQSSLGYWREQLRGVQALSLPTDYARPHVQRYLGSHRSMRLPDDLLNRLSALAAEGNGTLFMVLLAAFQMLLSRYTGQTDVAVGVPIANRTRVETESIVGTFVNTLVMRSDLDGNPSFTKFLERVRKTALEAYEHQDMPFERLVDELGAKRDLSHSPLVQVLFNVANAPIGPVEFAGLSWAPFEYDAGAAQFDLTLTVDTELTRLATLSYRTDLFAPGTVERMIGQYVQLLHRIVERPHASIAEYDILTISERHRMLVEWNATTCAYPLGATVPHLVRAQAVRRPEAVAVAMDGAILSYAELEARSNQLGRYLRRLGVKRGDLVGLCVDRSPDMVVGLLGIWKAGAAYVPLDPDYPIDRLNYMVDDSGSRVIVTTADLQQRVPPEGRRIVCLDRDAPAIGREDLSAEEGPSEEDLAYVIYTSGSTGRPKGVEISHRALTNFLCSMAAAPGCSSDDVLLAVTTLSFDIAGLELYLPLTVGGRIELVSRQTASDGRLLRKRLDSVRPTMMQATPATWRMLIDAGWSEAPQLTALCGGEALSRDLAEQVLPRVRALWNMYGPTETTIWSTLSKIEPGDGEITIGRPIANTDLYILDGGLQPVPVGVPGELYIGGAGVARGYRRRADLTAERFIPNPFSKDPSARIYRTGDQAKYLQDGQVVHLGRLDHQVKIRGFRIELGEIESALATHPGVKQSVVVARADRSGGRQLAAYLVASSVPAPAAADLRVHLRRGLPDYMVPSSFTVLETLPLTANGKVNRLALPDPSPEHSGGVAGTVLPCTPLEIQLAALWQQVLGQSDLGVHDNFFDLGGHSLTAVQLFADLEQVFGRQLPLATLFKAPTIAQLAEVLEREESVTHWRSLVTIQPTGSASAIFAVPGVGGNVLVFAKLAALLGRDQPFYGLQAIGLDGRQDPLTSVIDIAARYIAEIRSVRPEGPYLILGTCTGGVIAFEIAQQLKAVGEDVALMILESWHPSSYESYRTPPLAGWRRILQAGVRFPGVASDLVGAPFREWGGIVRTRLSAVRKILLVETGGDTKDMEIIYERVSRATFHAVATYQTTAYAGGLLNVIASHRVFGEDVTDTRNTWSTLAQAASSTVSIPAENSGRLFVSPHVEVLADVLRSYLDGRLQRNAGAVRRVTG